MKKNFFLTLMLALVALFAVQQVNAQAPVATPQAAITGLLNRIGGDGAASLFEIEIDATLDDANGKDVFIITSKNNKPCIKGNTQLSVATGINWYLNHYAHVNLTWNNLTTDLSQVELPVPTTEERRECTADYRYNFNTCTFSYSMAFWTEERWMQEIDWMALHGINAPLNLVGLETLWRNVLKDSRIGYTDAEIANFVAGPGFMAWFAMNNLEKHGSTTPADVTSVTMNGNPEWWYTRQEQLCRNMLQRMRELGMQPVLPGYSGMVPNSMAGKSINGINSGHIIESGGWGGFSRPDIINPSTESFTNMAKIYYEHLEALMGISEFYNMDPFHEGGVPTGQVSISACYTGVMAGLDNYFDEVTAGKKETYNTPEKAKWMVQYWQELPRQAAFEVMDDNYADRFIALDLFSENTYNGWHSKWDEPAWFAGCDFVYCMLHNFGGRSGLHGRMQNLAEGYFAAEQRATCKGIGATPEGIETNPALYDFLFELPWMSSQPNSDEWLKEYSYARYGVNPDDNALAWEALKNLRKSVWNCTRDQQGTSEAIILGRPRWTFGDNSRGSMANLDGTSVSSWSKSSIYWDVQDVMLAADNLISISDLVTTADGEANFSYDLIDITRQSLVDFAYYLLQDIDAAKKAGDNEEYVRLYTIFLDLMLDLDGMLSYDANFQLQRWTSLARNIAGEVQGTTDNDRNWLEWNARMQVTIWKDENNLLNDYSNRCWSGLIKDFHYRRWKYFFENNGYAPSSGWFEEIERPWVVDFTNYKYDKIFVPTDGVSAVDKAVSTFRTYFGKFTGDNDRVFIFPMGVTRDANNATEKSVCYISRGVNYELPFTLNNEVSISELWIDLNQDGAETADEKIAATGLSITIPETAKIGEADAVVTFSDNTVLKFSVAVREEITESRAVTATTADADSGTVSIKDDGTAEDEDAVTGSITNKLPVEITAVAKDSWNFYQWVDENDAFVSNSNPFVYYGKNAASFKAQFVQDKWGVVKCNGSFSADIDSYNSFIHNLTFTYYNREPEKIIETTTAPTMIFNTIPQIVNVARGASFDVEYDDGSGDGLKYCYFRAYIDLNADGDFDDEGELLKEVGTNAAQNTNVCSNKINVLLPYDMPLGITHLRLRFDGAWDNSNKPSALGAKSPSIRPVYEIVLNIVDSPTMACNVQVESNNEEWGTVYVYTSQTPSVNKEPSTTTSEGIMAIMVAEKTSDDVEFLGWYDRYDRKVSSELVNEMFVPEDAVYTARFRKFLEIDGWVIEYRTQPGDELRVKGNLPNGVAPEAGKKYYIYAPTSYSNTTASRYLYDNDGTLATNTSADFGNYVWTCIVNNDDTYSFQNASGKYLANNGSYHISIGETAAKYKIENPVREGCSLKNAADYTGGKYMVTKWDGSAFNRNGEPANGEWCSDYVFVEITTPDVVILTNVRQSGNRDLAIPEEVEILGEQCKIVGFDNGLFNNNRELLSITLPSTIEFLGDKVLFETSLKGENTPVSDSDNNPDNKISVIDLGFELKNSEAWEVVATYKSDGVSSFNQWGSGILYPNGDATGGELFYLSTQNKWSTCWHVRAPLFDDLGNDYFKAHTDTKISTFTVAVESKGNGKVVLKVTNSEGETQVSEEKDWSYTSISAFSAKLPKGLDITSFKVLRATEPDPFSGCFNLGEINISNSENYYVNNDGDLYNSNDVLICSPEGKGKSEILHNLAELIENTDALIKKAAEINPTGKETALPLHTNEGSAYYVSTNADQNTGGGSADGAGIAGLVDNSNDTHFHSRWGGTAVTAPHHILVDLGEGNSIANFKFSYVAHNSPDAAEFIVYGSFDGDDFYEIGSLTKGQTGVGATFTSEMFENTELYRYLRFDVTNSHGRGFGNTFGGYYCFGMKEFDLLNVTSTATLKANFELRGVTADEVAAAYDDMVNAQLLYNNGASKAQLQAAYDALKAKYDVLEPKMVYLPEGVYQIKYDGNPAFIGYKAAENGLSGDVDGYHLFDSAADDAPAAAQGDELFVITHNGVGHSFLAQGQYLQATKAGGWAPIFFSENEAQAGVYLFDSEIGKIDNSYDPDGGRFIRSTNNDIQYLNDWGKVFGNDKSNKNNPPLRNAFTLTAVTEYTLTVPASGLATLCLPFNVVLPEGVEAYDITADGVKAVNGRYKYEMQRVAAEGDVIAKGTPVIIKAAAGSHALGITMSDEGAIAAADGSALRGTFLKSTVGTAENNYLLTGNATFKLVTADATNVVANSCWLVLDERIESAIANANDAFVITIDEANPVLYKIIIKRADDGSKVLAYDEPTSEKIKIVDAAANKSYQAWYFMYGANGGILIKPYNAQGKMLTVESTGDGVGKAMIAADGASNFQEWAFTKSTVNGCTDYYYINVAGNNNPKGVFSHNGGFDKGDYMGIWNGGFNTNDGGSLFKFIDADFENDNARYYQLSDIFANAQNGSQLLGGTDPGCTPGSDAYGDAYAAAKSLVNAGNTADEAACREAYTALRGATYPTEPMIMPTVGAVYRIKNFVEKTAQQHYLLVNASAAVEFPIEAPEGNGALWVCTGENEGKYTFVNALGTAVLGWKAVGETAQEYTLQPGVARGALTLRGESSNLAFSGAGFNQGEKGQYNDWSTDWYLETVEDATIGFTRTMSSGSNYATLFLPYSVTVPEGVVAYTATINDVDTDEKEVSLTSVGDIIPARIAVVLHRENNSESADFNFEYTTDEGPAVVNNLFDGRVTTGYVGDNDNNYYLLLNGKRGEAFYKMYKEFNADGTLAGGNDGGHIKCEANKAYMKLPAGASGSYSFRFKNTTGIDEVEGENGEVKAIYDLQGRKLNEITKPGFYIVDGKKVLVK